MDKRSIKSAREEVGIGASERTSLERRRANDFARSRAYIIASGTREQTGGCVVAEALAALSSGAKFFRGDLHIHSYGASHDVKDPTATPKAIVDTAQTEGLSIVALTDHNEISNVPAAIEAGRAAGVFVIPGVELSTPEGHLLCYAPTADALERFFNRLQVVDRRTSQCRCQTGMIQCLDLLAAEGGFGVIAHIELDGAFETNVARFTPAKFDILCHPALQGIEVTKADCPILYDGRDTDADRRKVAVERIKRLKLGSEQYLARILNSDAHSRASPPPTALPPTRPR